MQSIERCRAKAEKALKGADEIISYGYALENSRRKRSTHSHISCSLAHFSISKNQEARSKLKVKHFLLHFFIILYYCT